MRSHKQSLLPVADDAMEEIISARDNNVMELFPDEFHQLYEVHSFRNAALILHGACAKEFNELVQKLITFRIKTEDMVAAGGNKSLVAKALEETFHSDKWVETHIKADLRVTRIFSEIENRPFKSGPRKGQLKAESVTRKKHYLIPGFVDGHKVDFVKGRVAFDLEWNSKDQTFDRDLYAVRALYECNIVAAGVLLTRSEALSSLFREIQNRVDIKDFKSKFGASTTWMGKLTTRLDAGRGGGCPILALGFKPAAVSDFDHWKSLHPVLRHEEFIIDHDEDESK